MSTYNFGLHGGHLSARADKIAQRHGARHINYTDPGSGMRCGWFTKPNQGDPFDRATASAVMQDIVAAGGLDALSEET